MRVRNVNGTVNHTCNCGDWLDHWKKFSDQSLPKFCPERGCLEKPELGAQVRKDDSTDTGLYIVPLCREHHAQNGKPLTIDDTMKLVPANMCMPGNK